MVMTLAPQKGQKNIFEEYPHVEYVADEGVQMWEELVAKGIDATCSLDSAKWQICDLALEIVRCFGGERSPRSAYLIDGYARAINAPPDRVREYCTVSRFWGEDDRREMARLRGITYTHMRDAMRLGDVNTAKGFLREVYQNAWNVSEAREKLIERLGVRPARKKKGAVSATLMQKAGTLYLFQFHLDPDEPSLVDLPIGAKIEISIYQSESEE